MPPFRLSRRAVLRGAGSIAIALPWLEIMRSERPARALPGAAQRFVAVYTPGGTVRADGAVEEQWSPTGSETNFQLSRILAPYEPVKGQLLVLDGIDMNSARGRQQQAGLIAWLTGAAQAEQSGQFGFATGPSIDRVISGRFADSSAIDSLELAVRWGTGRARGIVSPYGVVSFSVDGPRAPRVDPRAIWKDLFGALPADQENTAKWDKSVLDYVAHRYAALAGKLGAADKERVDQHLASVRELEKRLAATVAARCHAPTLIDTSDYDPNAGQHGDDAGTVFDVVTDAAIPKVSTLMLDMLVMALACDRTRVASFMWTDCEAKHSYPWLNLPNTFAYYQNGGGYQPEACAKIGAWYASQNSYLLQRMASVDMGGHSLLDESIVFFGSEQANPATHSTKNMPFLLAGNGGDLRTGRWLKYAGASHNDLLVSILGAFGEARDPFGDPAYCTGPLPNLF